MRTKYFFLAVLFSVVFISCNEEVVLDSELPEQEEPKDEDSKPSDKEPEKNENLKDCINREYNSSFILNVGGVDAERFLSKGVEYLLICKNFDGVTPGNALKYSSVVNNSGIMDFTDVKKIIQTAKDANLSVFGHTLCWHTQQRGNYFKEMMNKAIAEDPGTDITCLKIKDNADVAKRTVQPQYVFSNVLKPGIYTVTLTAKLLTADSPNIDFWTSLQSEKYDKNISIGGSPYKLTDDWVEISWNFEVPNDETKPFKKLLLQFTSTGNRNTEVLVDNVVFRKDNDIILSSNFETGTDGWRSESNSLIELHNDIYKNTSQIKKDVMLGIMEDWVREMMKACVVETDKGKDIYVKHWDAVNEPMSDIQPKKLKSIFIEGDDNGARFYWQDYLGKEYARYVIEYARKYYKEAGGNPDDLKLFINDYSLESNINKCQGLIDMIKDWESDGKTKIDGIGSQMHVTYSLNPAKQTKNEQNVIEMFELLANKDNTGDKLIKISELDMGISDENNKSINTKDVTEEMYEKMSDYYYFIITKYFEIIPKEKQYGITKWRLTDGGDTGFRANTPTGLWDRAYIKKTTYWGFLNGLIDGTKN